MGRIKVIQNLRVYSFRAKLALGFRKDSLKDRSLQVQLAGDLNESANCFQYPKR